MDTALTVEQGLRILALCVALAGTETLHGIARTLWVHRWLGKERALRLSVFTGTALAFGVCWWAVPGIGLQTAAGHLALGGVLAAFMASFDALLGHFVMRRPWAKVAQDFQPATGNWLVFGLAALVLIPWAVMALRGAAAA